MLLLYPATSCSIRHSALVFEVSATTSKAMDLRKRKNPYRETPQNAPFLLELGKKGSAGGADSGKEKSKRRIHWSWKSVSMLVFPATTFSLGCWQVYRLQWKTELIKRLESKITQEPVPFPEDDLSQIRGFEYAHVQLKGTFLHDRELIIRMRGRFDKEYQKKKNKSPEELQSNTGCYVITPFQLSKSGFTIMVNRGWIPSTKIDPSTRREGQVKGELSFDAIVRSSEKRSFLMPKNEPSKGNWFYKDFEEMANWLGTQPILVDATEESTVPGGPIGGQTNIVLWNHHLSYLLTWYGLTCLLCVMWFSKFYV